VRLEGAVELEGRPGIEVYLRGREGKEELRAGAERGKEIPGGKAQRRYMWRGEGL
jgi:hypothetical protein